MALLTETVSGTYEVIGSLISNFRELVNFSKNFNPSVYSILYPNFIHYNMNQFKFKGIKQLLLVLSFTYLTSNSIY